MKKAILVISLLLLGVGILFYPMLSNYIYELNGSYVIDDYQNTIDSSAKEELESEWKKAREYNDNLLGHPVRDPFIEGTGIVMPDNYVDILNINDTMGYIEIKKINVNLPIYHGTGDDVLQKGIGHLEGSTLPVGGKGTHCILTGHTGLTNAKIFTDLTMLQEGDEFYLHILDDTLAYKIDEIKVIEPEETEKIKRVDGQDYVTLLTCTPYGVNSHRLIVRGTRTPYHPEMSDSSPQSKSLLTKLTLIVAAVTSCIMLSLIVFVAVRKKKKQKRQ